MGHVHSFFFGSKKLRSVMGDTNFKNLPLSSFKVILAMTANQMPHPVILEIVRKYIMS